MPTYISLLRFTQKGVESIKDGPKEAGRREGEIPQRGR